MPTVDLNNILAASPRDAILPDAAFWMQPAGSDSFDDHLQRAQARTAEAADKQPDEKAAAPSQPAVAAADHADETPSGAAAPGTTVAAGSTTPESAPTTEVDGEEQGKAAEVEPQSRKENKLRADKKQSGPMAQADPSLRSDDALAAQQAAAAGHPEDIPAQVEPTGGRNRGNMIPGQPDGSADPAAQPLTEQLASKDDASLVAQELSGSGPASVRSVAEAKPSGHAGHHAADDSSAQATQGVQEAGTAEAVGQGPQSKLQASQAEGSRRPQRREKREEPATQVGNETASEQSLPDAKTAAATSSKLEIPVAAGSEITSAANKEKEAAADTNKTSSGQPAAETAGKQPIVAAREMAHAQSRPSSSAPPGESNELGGADQARFVERVAKAFQSVGDRGGAIRLRLSPPELGSLRVEISVREGVMSARLEAENHATRNLLLDNLPALRDRLAQQDIKVERFDVGLMDHSLGGSPGNTANSALPDDRGGHDYAPQRHAEPAGEAQRASDPGAARRPGEGSHLNLIV